MGEEIEERDVDEAGGIPETLGNPFGGILFLAVVAVLVNHLHGQITKVNHRAYDYEEKPTRLLKKDLEE